MDLLELLHKGGMDRDFLREALRVLVEGIMGGGVIEAVLSMENAALTGDPAQTGNTRVGTMKLHIPKLREGNFPSLLEPRRRSERALLAVIQQAYVEGVSYEAGGRSGQGPGV